MHAGAVGACATPGSHLPAMVLAMVPAIVSTVLSATGRRAVLWLRWCRKSLAKLNFPFVGGSAWPILHVSKVSRY